MVNVEECLDSERWDEWVIANNGHPLQLWGWGDLKSAHNWQTKRLIVKQADRIVGAAQVLIRRLPFPFNSLVYIPRGPVVEGDANRKYVLDSLTSYIKQTGRSVAITIEPDWEKSPKLKGWRQSKNTILIPKTLILDLEKSEDELLAAMTKKTRQYIRKSAKEGIEVRPIESRAELADCLEIYHQTAKRAGFMLHEGQYYYDVFNMMGKYSIVLAAYLEGRPVAFVWSVFSQATAFELYGGMNEDGQRIRANYLLKWESIRLMRERDVNAYDMNGLLNDGVSNFKRGFASHENMLVGTYDKPLSVWYYLWSYALPLGKKVVRKLKNR